jgi:hypothetical protein
MTPFLQAYVTAALWSSHDESTPDGGEPFDANYSADDLAPEALAKMQADCDSFVAQFGHLLTEENCTYRKCPVEEYAAHDFWLNRNGHGAGFWDGDWIEPAASILDKAAKSFGECNLYLGDDGRIYLA